MTPTADPPSYRSDIIPVALAHWGQLRGERQMPARSDIRPEDIVTVVPNMLLFDIERGPLDFRFRLVGTLVEEFMTERYTGKSMREIPHMAPPSVVFTDCMEATHGREPVHGKAPYVGPRSEFMMMESVVMPLSDDGEAANMLWVVVDYFGRGPDEHRMPGTR